MPFDFLLKDINSILTCKSIGTDKGLAKIGDGIVNLTYSIAKSIFLTKVNKNNKNIRTGLKVSKKILAEALKKADMKKFARSRADAHDLADTVEALIAYVWFCDKMTIEDIVDILVNSLSGDLNIRSEEIQNATKAFTKLLLHIKKFLPES
ncbi:MAG TPA: ribonuclease III family protein [Candidatus Nanopelagicaceae bacterium]|nr:ribonuclease III family protein [Candidatus Nanopelagicaceae bacterium]